MYGYVVVAQPIRTDSLLNPLHSFVSSSCVWPFCISRPWRRTLVARFRNLPINLREQEGELWRKSHLADSSVAGHRPEALAALGVFPCTGAEPGFEHREGRKK
jgi:hypothetical protein